MSHQVIVDYGGIALRLEASCEEVEARLQELDERVEQLRSGSTFLADSGLEGALSSIEEARRRIDAHLAEERALLERMKRAGRSTYNGNFVKAIRSVDDIRKERDELLGARYEALCAAVDGALARAGRSEEAGRRSGWLPQIALIEEPGERFWAYQAATSGERFEDFASLREKAREMAEGKCVRSEELSKRVMERLRKAGVAPTAIGEILKASSEGKDVESLVASATEAAVRERTRRKAVRAIRAAIMKQGFHVDSRAGIRIDREKDVVRMLAVRSDGKRAEFEIRLNGSFLYKLDRYEGMACEKDSAEFLKVLEEVYGMDVRKRKVVWENPDRLSKKRFQHAKVRKQEE